MTSVGVRELRQRASELLRQVRHGESIEITDRGRPVAMLTPLPQGNELERLRDAGQVRSADGDLDDLPEALPLVEGQPPPSVVLAGLRRHDR